jgi:hypothetical protein
VLRNIVGGERTDHMRLQDFRHECRIQQLGEWVKIQRTEWNNYVSRIAPDRIVQIAKVNSSKGRRNPGRQHKRRQGSDSQENRPMAYRRGEEEASLAAGNFQMICFATHRKKLTIQFLAEE